MAVPSAKIVVSRLLGRWEGMGAGEFPTISAFAYREQLDVIEQSVGVVHYVQRTWRLINGDEVGSHIETGFISVHDDMTVEMLNAQGSDRTEVLTGSWSIDDGTVSLELHSAELAHDDRMISSWRCITIATNEFSYTMGMATTSVPNGARHLAAHLQRR